MNKSSLYDISEVCKRLGITSRTLRFYEDKGIITSTTVGLSARRQYTDEQIAHIRNVLTLRMLGLSVKSIAELQVKECNLKDAVLSTRAEILASIESRTREIHLLNEALSALESGKNLFEQNLQHPPEPSVEEQSTAQICTQAVVQGDNEMLYRHLSSRLAQYMPEDVYSAVRKDKLAPLGEFVAVEKILSDDQFPNRWYAFVRYAKFGLKITFVFYSGQIDGLWLGYYEVK